MNLAKEIDKNLNKYLNEKSDISKYKDLYTFKNNVNILNSFIKIFNDYDLAYKPRSKTKEVSSQYLLNKLKKSKKIPKELFQYFDGNIRDNELTTGTTVFLKASESLYFLVFFTVYIACFIIRDKKKINLKFELHSGDDIPLIPEIIEDDNKNNIVSIEQHGKGALNNIKIDENS